MFSPDFCLQCWQENSKFLGMRVVQDTYLDDTAVVERRDVLSAAALAVSQTGARCCRSRSHRKRIGNYRSTDQWEVAAIATTADRRYRNQIGKSPLGTLRANAEDSLSLLCEQARKVPLTMSTSTPTPSTSLVLSWRKLAGWRKNGQRSRTGIQHFNRMISGLLDDGLGSWTGALGSIRVQVGPGPNWTQVEKIIN
jgi:hypothetical protein